MSGRLVKSCLLLVFVFIALESDSYAADTERKLISRWLLAGSAKSENDPSLDGKATDVEFNAKGPMQRAAIAGRWNGRSSVVEVPPNPKLNLGKKDFSISLWLSTEKDLDDQLGDLVSQYDPATRTGFHLGLYNHWGVTNGQSNTRQLHFGIDQGRIESTFQDHGRLGNAVYVFSMCIVNDRLYAATCETGMDGTGHVFRFEEGDRWTDLGSPDKANAVSAMVEFNGALYVASSKYRLAGSALPESTNPNFGGKVFRLGDDDKWVECGTLSSQTEAVGGLIVYRGRLYAGSLYRPAGFFRYEGGDKWTVCETPEGKRVESLTVHNGEIYATSYDEGSVFRFNGERWERAGKIPEATQTYGFAVHRGALHVSEWPKARVFRFLGGTEWQDVGKLGEEYEAMPIVVYNGKLYGGTLPRAEVYRYDGDQQWTKIGCVDPTPNVQYRRAWSMAIYRGRLFVGTLPSGRVLSIEAGQNVTVDKSLSPGWHHIVATRESRKLKLFVDDKLAAESKTADIDFDLTNNQPLKIGFGAQDHFNGILSDVRLEEILK